MISRGVLFPLALQKQLFVYQSWCISVRKTVAHKDIMAGLWLFVSVHFHQIWRLCSEAPLTLLYIYQISVKGSLMQPWRELRPCSLPYLLCFPSFHILWKFRWHPGPRKKVKPYQGLYLQNEHAAVCTWIFSLSQCPNEVSDCIWSAYLAYMTQNNKSHVLCMQSEQIFRSFSFRSTKDFW